MRKKLAVELALPVLVFGAIGALFFLKEPAEQVAARQRAAADAPFRETVERRLPTDAAGQTGRVQSVPRRTGGSSFRVPTAAAAPFSEGDARASEMSASYKRTFGSILQPLQSSDPDASAAEGDPNREEPSDGKPRLHRIADGDTLRKLAGAYLGDSERYLEIYELNRATLASADLLPIGGVLKIPPRQRPAAQASGDGASEAASNDEENLPLVPILKGTLGGVKN